MPAKMILTLLFFVSLCVVVILALRALPQRMNGGTAETREEILVAATMLQIGTLLRAKDVSLAADWRQRRAGADHASSHCSRQPQSRARSAGARRSVWGRAA